MVKWANDQMVKCPRDQTNLLYRAKRWTKAAFSPSFLAAAKTSPTDASPWPKKLDRGGKFRRIIEQLAASGSSVGANLAEADQAMSRRDFRKCLAIAAKELA